MPNKGIRGNQVNNRKGRKFENDPDQKRARNQRNLDPYVPEEGRPEPAVCSQCHAVYKNKRWYLDATALLEEERKEANFQSITCPACQKIAERYPEGIVTLTGGYLWDHEEEIRNILKNEETKAMNKNPLERIIRMERDGNDLVIETTEEKLAEHLGRVLHRAHQGDLEVSWSGDHSVCRVRWERPA